MGKICLSLWTAKEFVFQVMLTSLLVFTLIAACQASPSGQWLTLETEYLVVHYQNPEDLEVLGGKIKYNVDGWSLFRRQKAGDQSSRLIRNVDNLFYRVQILLDMKRKSRKVPIYLFPDSRQFQQAFTLIHHDLPPVNAFARYIPKERSVYIVLSQIDEGTLAREMAHAIAYNYLAVKPSRKATDILASYVDRHLYDRSAPQVYN